VVNHAEKEASWEVLVGTQLPIHKQLPVSVNSEHQLLLADHSISLVISCYGNLPPHLISCSSLPPCFTSCGSLTLATLDVAALIVYTIVVSCEMFEHVVCFVYVHKGPGSTHKSLNCRVDLIMMYVDLVSIIMALCSYAHFW